MVRPKGSQRISPANNWIRLGSLLWKSLSWIWISLILGLVINFVTNFFVTNSFPVTGTPLGWFIAHPWIALLILLSLVLLTILSWYAQYLSRNSSTLIEPSLVTTEKQRSQFIRLIRQQYDTLLASSLQGSASIELGLHARPDMVSPLTHITFRRNESNNTTILPSGTSITEVFDANPQGLLILGEPGSGKTTLLLELARELLQRAEHDPNYPMPVIVNLSSWARNRQPLTVWLVEQLSLTYMIPQRLARTWVMQEQLLFLFDGLDEVAASDRSACIEAINSYRQEHLTPIVICSRRLEYTIEKTRLLLPTAIEIQPLTLGCHTEYCVMVYS